MTIPDLDEEVTPEVGDEYVHASVISHVEEEWCVAQ